MKEIASIMLFVAGLPEPNWECTQGYAVFIYNKTTRPEGKYGELKSPDDIYYEDFWFMKKYDEYC